MPKFRVLAAKYSLEGLLKTCVQAGHKLSTDLRLTALFNHRAEYIFNLQSENIGAYAHVPVLKGLVYTTSSKQDFCQFQSVLAAFIPTIHTPNNNDNN